MYLACWASAAFWAVFTTLHFIIIKRLFDTTKTSLFLENFIQKINTMTIKEKHKQVIIKFTLKMLSADVELQFEEWLRKLMFTIK